MSVTFEDVAMYFSSAEWALLGEEQKQLYRHVMWENYQTLVSLGIKTPKPVVIFSIERGEDLCVRGPTEDEDGDILRGTHPDQFSSLSTSFRILIPSIKVFVTLPRLSESLSEQHLCISLPSSGPILFFRCRGDLGLASN
ncbi:zinc finger protein 316-like isoform X7 [Chrysemys picta bellii]|uniref:zinc finger protein 316-like isoform X7 n=1 Tax=Chrysemys picta bellii TaxID=8478 RepID=UPI0032B2BED4